MSIANQYPGIGSPQIVTRDFSLTVGQTAEYAWSGAPLGGNATSYMKIQNVSASATIWYCRTGIAAVQTAGSFSLLPGEYELWAPPSPIPVNALSIISTEDSTPVSIEVG